MGVRAKRECGVLRPCGLCGVSRCFAVLGAFADAGQVLTDLDVMDVDPQLKGAATDLSG